jgi:hypothetical protein
MPSHLTASHATSRLAVSSADGGFNSDNSTDTESQTHTANLDMCGTSNINPDAELHRSSGVSPGSTEISLTPDTLPGGILSAVRSDEPHRQPVDTRWFAAGCRASLQECETVITLAARQIAANDETSKEYQRLKELAARAVTRISASLSQLISPTVLARNTWRATAEACESLSAEADNFPFDGWVSRCETGCRQLAAVARRASFAGVEN